MQNSDWTAAKVLNAHGKGPWLLVCEHASDAIPAELNDLGLSETARRSHAAWDIGAMDVATELSRLLDAPLVAGAISRLVYDCNRPLEAQDSIPARSEIYDIAGNADLDQAQKQDRFDRVHQPFHAAVSAQRHMSDPELLVTIHSFTPVYNGQSRTVELGFLYHSDASAAERLLAHEKKSGRYQAALNEPYSAADGVTYSLEKHGEALGLPAVMIEIRNDLIATPTSARAMAAHLATGLRASRAAAEQEAAE